MRVIGGCKNGDCPKIMVGEDGHLQVQGLVTDRLAPSGEAVVTIPRDVLLEAAAVLLTEERLS